MTHPEAVRLAGEIIAALELRHPFDEPESRDRALNAWRNNIGALIYRVEMAAIERHGAMMAKYQQQVNAVMDELMSVAGAARNLEHYARNFVMQLEQAYGPQPKFGNGPIGHVWAECATTRAALALIEGKGADDA